MKRLITIGLAALALSGGVAVRAQQPARKFVPVTGAMLQKPDQSDWLMWRRTLDGWGFSPLTQINRNNVSQLKMVWAHGLGPGNQEGTPIVHERVTARCASEWLRSRKIAQIRAPVARTAYSSEPSPSTRIRASSRGTPRSSSASMSTANPPRGMNIPKPAATIAPARSAPSLTPRPTWATSR